MKTMFKIPALMVMTVMLVAGSAMAYPFTEVVGTVNPFAATIVDHMDGTSTISGLKYEFTVTGADFGAEMNFVSLEFEGAVFKSVSSAMNYDPADWTASSMVSSAGNLYTLSSAGTTIAVGESLSFLVDVDIYTAALTDAAFWSEGQVWGQSWLSGDTLHGGDGGSTAPVPEPATMLLLGTGLAGLAAVRRRNSRKA